MKKLKHKEVKNLPKVTKPVNGRAGTTNSGRLAPGDARKAFSTDPFSKSVPATTYFKSAVAGEVGFFTQFFNQESMPY